MAVSPLKLRDIWGTIGGAMAPHPIPAPEIHA
jgi:hypothetical protein